jgi:hypothetical protein
MFGYYRKYIKNYADVAQRALSGYALAVGGGVTQRALSGYTQAAG